MKILLTKVSFLNKIMENKKLNNPNAFPIALKDNNNPFNRDATGMSLRDYFAAKVLQGISSLDDKRTFNNIEEALAGQAKYCYLAADAMLKQREL
jgi:hypothetical protein